MWQYWPEDVALVIFVAIYAVCRLCAEDEEEEKKQKAKARRSRELQILLPAQKGVAVLAPIQEEEEETGKQIPFNRRTKRRSHATTQSHGAQPTSTVSTTRRTSLGTQGYARKSFSCHTLRYLHRHLDYIGERRGD
jgi:hypothetical protein